VAVSSGISKHLRSNAVAYVALFFALSGSAWALANDAVKSKHIKDEQVRTGDVANDDGAYALTGEDIADASLDGDDLGENTLGGLQIDESTLELDQEVVTEYSAGNSNSPKSVMATCPEGKTAIAASYDINPNVHGSTDDYQIDVGVESFGVATTQAYVTAYELGGGTADPWSVGAQAHCARLDPGSP